MSSGILQESGARNGKTEDHEGTSYFAGRSVTHVRLEEGFTFDKFQATTSQRRTRHNHSMINVNNARLGQHDAFSNTLGIVRSDTIFPQRSGNILSGKHALEAGFAIIMREQHRTGSHWGSRIVQPMRIGALLS